MSNYWTNARRRKISRRTMLGASAKAGVGAAGLALVGCGGDDDDDDAAPAAAEAQAEAQAEEQAMDEDEQAQAEEQAMDEDEEEQAAAAAGGPVRGGQIGLTWSESIYGGFNPYISLSGADHLGYLIYLYDSVLGFDKAGRIEPELAESWELPDDVTYIFNMRPGALFQDGAPCDAHALQANMEYLRNTEDLAGQARAQAGISKSISREVVDDLSWRMVNSEPFAPTLVNFLASPGTGMLISPNHFETTITNPVGAGPMFQTDYNEGENWVTERWDGYWDNDNVWVDGLEKLIIPTRTRSGTRSSPGRSPGRARPAG